MKHALMSSSPLTPLKATGTRSSLGTLWETLCYTLKTDSTDCEVSPPTPPSLLTLTPGGMGPVHPPVPREAPGQREWQVLEAGRRSWVGTGTTGKTARDKTIQRIAYGPSSSCDSTFHGLSHQPNEVDTVILPTV